MKFLGYGPLKDTGQIRRDAPFIEIELAPNWHAWMQDGECLVVKWISEKRRTVIEHVPATREGIVECLQHFDAKPWEWALDFIEQTEARLKARRTVQ